MAASLSLAPERAFRASRLQRNVSNLNRHSMRSNRLLSNQSPIAM